MYIYTYVCPDEYITRERAFDCVEVKAHLKLFFFFFCVIKLLAFRRLC